MSVFRTFYKVVSKYKGTIILYTMMLIIFGGINLVSEDTTTNFTSSKPDILIINNDEETIITNNLIKYLSDVSNVKDIDNDTVSISDALFYRDVNYIVYIPKNYTKDLINGGNTTIDIKSTNDYMSSLEEMMLSNYLDLQSSYLLLTKDQNELVKLINDTLDEESNVVMTSKVDVDSNISRYFNFASYSILAIIIFIITLVLTSFKEKTINKRIIVSSMNYKKHNGLLFKSSVLYALIVWILFCLLALIIFGSSLINMKGLLLFVNVFIFTMYALSTALVISSLVNNKDAIGGIVNSIALGSAFLCGAFIPTYYLPDGVIKVSKVFGAYYYNNANDLIVKLSNYDFISLKPVLINYIVMIIFMIVFLILNNVITKHKRNI